MSYPFDCFKTIQNISLEKLKKNSDINSIFSSSKEESILNEYKLEIEEYKKKIGINTFSFEILKKLSENFDKNKKEYIERFFKELILLKVLIMNIHD